MASPTGYADNRPKTIDGPNDGTSAPVWSAATDYALGDEVEHEGVIWTAVADPLVGSEPTFSSTDWDPGTVKGTQVGKQLNPDAPLGTSQRVTLGPDEGQPATVIAADESQRTTPEA